MCSKIHAKAFKARNQQIWLRERCAHIPARRARTFLRAATTRNRRPILKFRGVAAPKERRQSRPSFRSDRLNWFLQSFLLFFWGYVVACLCLRKYSTSIPPNPKNPAAPQKREGDPTTNAGACRVSFVSPPTIPIKQSVWRSSCVCYCAPAALTLAMAAPNLWACVRARVCGGRSREQKSRVGKMPHNPAHSPLDRLVHLGLRHDERRH